MNTIQRFRARAILSRVAAIAAIASFALITAPASAQFNPIGGSLPFNPTLTRIGANSGNDQTVAAVGTSSLAVNTFAPISVTVVNSGKPVPNASVDFVCSVPSTGVCSVNGTPKRASVVTDATGKASAIIKTGGFAGPFTVAALTGLDTLAFQLTAAPAAVTYVAKLSGVPQTAHTYNGAAPYGPIQLSLTSADGKPAPAGVPVTWQRVAASSPAVGCAMYLTANEAAATHTDAQGMITLVGVHLTAPGKAILSASGPMNSVGGELTATPPINWTFVVSGGSQIPALGPNGFTFFKPITIQILADGSAPPSSLPVTFAIAVIPSGGSASVGTPNVQSIQLMTDAQGSVTLNKLGGYSVMAKGVGAYKVSIQSGPIGTTIVNLTLTK